MLATLIAATFIADNATANDYFPLVAGTRRTYEEKVDNISTSVDEVGAPVDVKGVAAIPVVTTEAGRAISKTYYKVDGSTVWIIGSNPEHPLPKPIPIVQVNGEKTSWSYDGPTDDTKLAESISMTGQSRMLPPRDVLGKKVSILEVKLITAMGGGRAQERSEQTALYGKGIGLIQLTSKTTVGKHKATNELKLIQVEEAKAGG